MSLTTSRRIEVAERVRVPERLLNCVAFINEVTVSDSAGDDLDPCATGFFVSIPSEAWPGTSYRVLVTAKHVAKALLNREIEIMVNTKGGGVKNIASSSDHWLIHPTDESVDVAILPVKLDAEMDVLSICATKHFWTPGPGNVDLKVGIGDEVFFPGLFTFAPGKRRNIPLLRHGNLAMIPDEPIQVENGFAEVYLIEARSIGGMSGAPVFVRPTVQFNESLLVKNSTRSMLGLSSELRLLGLVHGHWDISESEMNSPKYRHAPQRGVNLGIAVVVPAKKILEVLQHPELQAMIRAHEDAIRRGVVPTNDVADIET